MAKSVRINFSISGGLQQSNFPQYVYTGLTESTATGTTVNDGCFPSTSGSCSLTGLDNSLTFIYVKITCPHCNDNIFKVSLLDPTPTPTPTSTPTVTPTLTVTATAGLTNTPTPTPPASTPTHTPPAPTQTQSEAAPVPTPTATTLPGCGSTITDSWSAGTNTTQTHFLNLSDATNGSTISIHYTANERPDRFNIYDDSSNLVVTSGWVGSDYNYTGPWTSGGISDTDGDGYMSFTYDSSKTYRLLVEVGPWNPANQLSDSWSVTISCLGLVPTQTASEPAPTPTATPLYTYYKLRPCEFQGSLGYTDGDYDVWSEKYLTGTFNSGDRVEGSTDYFYVVVGSQASTEGDPTNGGSKYSVSRVSGQFGCPDAPPPVVYRTAKIFAWTTTSGPFLNDVKTDACGKIPYQLPGGYVAINGGSGGYISDPAITTVTPSTIYTLYDANVGGNVINGGNKWHAILYTNGGNTFTYVAYITDQGQIQDWTPCSPPPTPTATTPAPTPTTSTPSQGGSSGCVTVSQADSYEQINCLGQGPYTNTITRVTGTLDTVASVDVTIMVNATRTYCYGSTSPETYYITITAGNTSNYVDITTNAYVDCGQESYCVVEMISIDSYTSITPNYSVCG